MMSVNNQKALLTFRLADQYYALPIENVIEVAAMMRVSTLSNAPAAILGLINRHGAAVPILDLRIAFNLIATGLDESTLFIVAQGSNYHVGLIVDEILQVKYVDASAVKVAQGLGRYTTHIISDGEQLYQQVQLQTLYEDYLKTIES